MTEDPRISEIRAVLTEYVRTDDLDALFGVRRRIRAIVDREPPAPRVFFPGDTVPAHTPVVNHVGGVWRQHTDRVVKTGWAVELQLPADVDLQAAVEHARDARADAMWQHTEGVTP